MAPPSVLLALASPFPAPPVSPSKAVDPGTAFPRGTVCLSRDAPGWGADLSATENLLANWQAEPFTNEPSIRRRGNPLEQPPAAITSYWQREAHLYCSAAREIMTQVNCRRCRRSILETTSARTGGLCMACQRKGARRIREAVLEARDGFEIHYDEKLGRLDLACEPEAFAPYQELARSNLHEFPEILLDKVTEICITDVKRRSERKVGVLDSIMAYSFIVVFFLVLVLAFIGACSILCPDRLEWLSNRAR